jgi:hypothetical protein
MHFEILMAKDSSVNEESLVVSLREMTFACRSPDYLSAFLHLRIAGKTTDVM